MEFQDKYNKLTEEALRTLREEEDKTVFDEDVEVYDEDDGWWSSSY